ncbi:hypothetical protein MAR_026726 [Mya arenaria]|uniref:Uncharacterized protein n=1 Tax=Mya arenaria TaxID=6604 RepID=A0ABY7EUZ6_MYAAR|nr:hypothetical protein MAR_026726 [Mya arenaria]
MYSESFADDLIQAFKGDQGKDTLGVDLFDREKIRHLGGTEQTRFLHAGPPCVSLFIRRRREGWCCPSLGVPTDPLPSSLSTITLPGLSRVLQHRMPISRRTCWMDCPGRMRTEPDKLPDLQAHQTATADCCEPATEQAEKVALQNVTRGWMHALHPDNVNAQRVAREQDHDRFTLRGLYELQLVLHAELPERPGCLGAEAEVAGLQKHDAGGREEEEDGRRAEVF